MTHTARMRSQLFVKILISLGNLRLHKCYQTQTKFNEHAPLPNFSAAIQRTRIVASLWLLDNKFLTKGNIPEKIPTHHFDTHYR